MRTSASTKADIEVPIGETEVEALASTFRGELLRPGDAGYDAARVVFNGLFDRRPALILRCRGTADVIDAVRFARGYDLPVAVRGGGHNVAGTSTCDGGIVIDLSLMRGVLTDPDRRIARVQGGALWGDVDRETQAFGLATPGGIVSHTGVAGLTLNGGLGWLRSKHGTSCDNLARAEVVTADGERIVAGEEENADLLWALRGGGGNFGVVTTFDFRLHPVGPEVATVFAWYPIERFDTVARRWRDWVLGAPEEVTSELITWTMPAIDPVPEPVRGKTVVIPSAVHCGDPEEGMRALQPLRELDGPPIVELAAPIPFRVVQTAFDVHFPNTGEALAYWKAQHAPALGDDLLDLLRDLAAERSSPSTMIFAQHLGAGVQRFGPDHAAFAGRVTPFVVAVFGGWRDPAESERHIDWVREASSRIASHTTGAPYLNYVASEERDPAAVVRAAFGDRYGRLVDVKTKYDPTNFFRLNQNIPPRPR